jgi:hypothetical protein
MRQPLHEGDELSVYFAIDEDTDETFIELESSAIGPDLSDPDDMVVAVGGSVASFDRLEPDRARAVLGIWPDLEQQGLELMIRVGEWFESWELE